MDKEDKIRACYLHACLKYVSGEHMTNQSLRNRFGIEEKNYSIASRIIAEGIKSGLIKDYDGFIISSPEHNGGTPAFFKNIIDWLSRREKNVFEKKPIFIMSTSPGPGAGATHLKYLINSLPYQGATIGASYSLPSFSDNFKEGKVIGDQLAELKVNMDKFVEALNG